MKKESTIITILFALASLTMTAQDDTASTNPDWLWEISGNGLQQKSYIYGTCHGEGHKFTKKRRKKAENQDNK